MTFAPQFFCTPGFQTHLGMLLSACCSTLSVGGVASVGLITYNFIVLKQAFHNHISLLPLRFAMAFVVISMLFVSMEGACFWFDPSAIWCAMVLDDAVNIPAMVW